MNLRWQPIAEPKIELGSETIPVFIETKDLQPFLEKHKHLHYV
jgi:hypothetical protein